MCFHQLPLDAMIDPMRQYNFGAPFKIIALDVVGQFPNTKCENT